MFRECCIKVEQHGDSLNYFWCHTLTAPTFVVSVNRRIEKHSCDICNGTI